MSENKENVPKIRFSGFNDAWEQRRLGDHAEILTGGTPKTTIPEYWEPKEIPWMSSGEVNKRRLDETDNMISEEGLNNSSARWVEEHSVLIALAGQGKTRGTVAINNIPLTTNQSIAAIVPDETLHYEFIYQNLIKRYDELRMISSGDETRGGLNKQIVSDVVIAYPRYEEQVKIGDFFAQLDSLSTLHQCKLDNVQNLKAGLLQKMIPKEGEDFPEVRFPGFTDAWEQRTLDEIADILDGDRGNNYPNGSELQERGHTLFLSATNVTTNGFMFDNNQYITEQKSNSMGNGKLVVDDIVLTSRGSIGHIAWYNEATQQQIPFARINSGMLILRSKDIVIPSFVVQFLKSPLGKKQIDFISFGSAQPQLTKKDVSKYIVSLPSDCAEQRKLGDFFDTIDHLITLHQRKLKHLQEQKQALLQQMFV